MPSPRLQPRSVPPSTLFAWMLELGRTAPGLIRCYLPGSPLTRRAREGLMLAVAEADGCRYTAWVHGSWSQYLGGGDEQAEGALLDFALASARAGKPVDPGTLCVVLPADTLMALRAAVAQAEVSNLAGRTVDALGRRVRGKRSWGPVGLAQDIATLAISGPIAAPFAAVAGAMRMVDRLLPPMPTVETPVGEEPNLLAHLLAESIPAQLSGAAARSAMLALPVTVGVAIRSGRSSATIRFGRSRISVENGVRDDAWLVIDGEMEPLLRAASQLILRELSGVEIRPG